jgi:hypothetical protein
MTIFATLDAAGQPFELEAGQPFHTYPYVVADAEDAAYHEAAVGETIAYETSHPGSHLWLFGDEDFDRYGIQRVEDPVPPAGQELISYSLAVDGAGAISVVPVFGPA